MTVCQSGSSNNSSFGSMDTTNRHSCWEPLFIGDLAVPFESWCQVVWLGIDVVIPTDTYPTTTSSRNIS